MLSDLSPRLRKRFRFLTGFSVVVVLAAGLSLGSATVATAGPLAILVLAREWRRRRLRIMDRETGAMLIASIDELIQHLRSGCSLRQSCERLSGDRSPLVELSHRLRSGATLAEAARSLDEKDSAARLLSVTLQVLVANGGPAVPALQRLRQTLLSAVQAGQQADSEASQAMASAGLLVAAPGVFATAIAALDANAARLYLFEPIGVVCVLTALVMSYLGWCWMQRILVTSLAMST